MTTDQKEIGMEVASVGETSSARVDQPDEPMSLVQMALERGVEDVEVIERLVALQERVEERNAEKAMARALAKFQAECPAIPRVATADVRKNGQKVYDYTFAPYDQIVRVIREPLANNGLSYRHDVKVESGQVTVTCTLQHDDGATRTSTFEGPTDTSGGKNPLQAVGSSQSYGKRYTVTNVLGLATEEDDDGKGAHRQEVQTLDDEQIAAVDALLDEITVPGAKGKMLRWVGVNSVADIPVGWYDDVIELLEKKRGAS